MEIWKYHPIYDNYMGSNFGNIKNINRKENSNGSIIFNEKIISVSAKKMGK